MSSGVTVDSIKKGFLGAIIARFPSVMATFPDESIEEAIAEAEALVARELSTRFGVTQFIPERSASELPALDEGSEYEAPHQWPGRVPGDGFPVLTMRVRPVVEVQAMTLDLPGAIISQFEIPSEWLRVDRATSGVLVAPCGGHAAYALAYGQGMMNWRLPMTTWVKYRAGLSAADLAGKWAPVRRLVAVHAFLTLAPTLSMWMNPGNFSSESADGLSQSRSTGYVFKDMEERLGKEAEDLKRRILDMWDGPGLIVL